jgi:AcrR family transcriptional regulator
VRLTPLQIVAAAIELASAHGWDELTWAALAAAVGVKPPSLYNHFASLRAVSAAAAAVGLEALHRELTLATVGKSGEEAVYALALSYRRFTQQRAALYTAVTRFGDPDDPAWRQIVALLQQLLIPFGLTRSQMRHAVRGLRAIVHGFSALENSGGFRSPVVGRDESFRWLIACFIDGLRRQG